LGYAYGKSSIALDSSNSVYVTNSTYGEFPITPNAFQTRFAGSYDVVIAKLNATGTALLYSSPLGGSGYDTAGCNAVDLSVNSYVTGSTSSVNFPVTPGAFQSSAVGGAEVFVAKITDTTPALGLAVVSAIQSERVPKIRVAIEHVESTSQPTA